MLNAIADAKRVVANIGLHVPTGRQTDIYLRYPLLCASSRHKAQQLTEIAATFLERSVGFGRMHRRQKAQPISFETTQLERKARSRVVHY
jgi:hypothetical protein